MDRRLWPVFRLFHILSVLFSWWVVYRFYKIRGIYPGPIPESGGEELAYYVYHPLMGLLNIMTVCSVAGGMTIAGALGSMQMILRKPIKVNLVLLSVMINAIWIMLYGLDWAQVIQ